MGAELSSAPGTRPGRPGRAWRWVALALLLVALTWGLTVWRWRAAGAEPQATDLALQLLVLPLALLAAVAVAWRVAHASRVAPAHAATGSAAAGAEAPAAPPLAPWARVLDLSLCCAAARDTATLLSAAQAGLPLPRPDATLSHSDGLPVMCARIVGLPPSGHTAGSESLRPAVLRALAALQQPLHQALAAADGWLARADPEALPNAPRNDFQLRREAAPVAVATAPCRLRLGVAWPGGWSADERARAQQWLATQVQQAGLAHRVAPALAATDEPRTLAALLQRTQHEMAQAQAHDGPALWLLLACHSDLDDDALHALALQGRLFHAQDCPQGRIASEAAVALLLAPPGAALAGADAPGWLSSLDPAALAPASSAAELELAAGALLQACACPVEGLAGVVSDADRHGRAALQLVQTCSALGVALPSPEALVLTGPVAGQGPSSAGLVLAAALAHSRQAGGPCLALVHADTEAPLALLVHAA